MIALLVATTLVFSEPIFREVGGHCGNDSIGAALQSPREIRVYQYRRRAHWDPSSVPPLTWALEGLPRLVAWIPWNSVGVHTRSIVIPDTCGAGTFTVRTLNAAGESCDSNYQASH